MLTKDRWYNSGLKMVADLTELSACVFFFNLLGKDD